jgi:hypothetical protein
MEAIKRHIATAIWKERGSPTGEAGRAVEQDIWFEAGCRAEKELQKIAYGVWEERGSPKGEDDPAGRDRDWAEAKLRFYKALSGHDYRESLPPAGHKARATP